MAKVYYEKDAKLTPLKGKTVAIIGYGSQGHAQAQNLRDSGVNVVIAELEGTSNYKLAVKHGFKPLSAAEATKQGDVIQILLPDELQARVYKSEIEPNLSKGKAIGFSHGFNIHFGQIVPPKNVDVIMVAPKGPGHIVRRQFVEGKGVPALIAVHQNPGKDAKKIALAWAKGVGGTRAEQAMEAFQDEATELAIARHHLERGDPDPVWRHREQGLLHTVQARRAAFAAPPTASLSYAVPQRIVPVPHKL